MRESKSVKFSPSSTALMHGVLCLLFSIVPLFWLWSPDTSGFTIASAFILSSFMVYKGVSCMFVRRISTNETNFIYKHGPFTYRLNPDDVAIYYEPVFVLKRSSTPIYGLVLHRNKNKNIGFHLNNSFVLAYDVDDLELYNYRRELKNKFDIDIVIFESV